MLIIHDIFNNNALILFSDSFILSLYVCKIWLQILLRPKTNNDLFLGWIRFFQLIIFRVYSYSAIWFFLIAFLNDTAWILKLIEVTLKY